MHNSVVLHQDALRHWLDVRLGYVSTNAIAGNKTDEAGGNGYRGGKTTTGTLMAAPGCNVHAVVDGLALTAGRLNYLFVSDSHISLVFYG
jgi:hypothetical protein